MIKLKDLLKEKKLRVFDFDDTLVKTKAKVYIILLYHYFRLISLLI